MRDSRAQPRTRLAAPLALLVMLLVLTEAFGRSFSRIGIDSASLFVTEVMLLAMLALSLRSHGVRKSIWLVRDRIPLALLALLLLGGLVATVRGIASSGISLTLNDIGLAEYSILLVIVVLIVDNDTRSECVTNALAFGGLATIFAFGSSEIAERTFGDTFVGFPPSAAGMYLSFYIIWVAVRIVRGTRVSALYLIGALVALVEVGLTQSRGAWVAVGGGLLTVALVVPGWRRKALGVMMATLAIAFSILGGLTAEDVLGTRPSPAVENGQTDAEGGSGPLSPIELSVSTKVATLPAGDADAQWRLDYWAELLSRSVEAPIIGAGFGVPSDFVWRGIEYDTRDGEPSEFAVTGPHNGFIDILYRMGVPAFAGLIGLIAIALGQLRGRVSGGLVGDPRRARSIALLGMFMSALLTASLNDALRVPYLAIFFWTLLGLLLVESRFGRRDPS